MYTSAIMIIIFITFRMVAVKRIKINDFEDVVKTKSRMAELVPNHQVGWGTRLKGNYYIADDNDDDGADDDNDDDAYDVSDDDDQDQVVF